MNEGGTKNHISQKDYVIYGDTDSVYVGINDFCIEHFGKEFWEKRDTNEKIQIIDKLSDEIKDYINKKIFEDVQCGVYNSVTDDFQITFKKEKIAISGLFVTKKKYSTKALWTEGSFGENISTKGLDIVRSDSSEIVREKLKDIMSMILSGEPDDKISLKIQEHKKYLEKNTSPEEIAANIGVNGINKYIVNGKSTKGTPWHIKGVANYRFLLKDLKIKNKYEDIYESIKAKVVYIKDNKYNMETVTFHKWPKEFENIIDIDREKMIYKFFTKKVEMLLDPIGKKSLLDNFKSKKVINLFFGK